MNKNFIKQQIDNIHTAEFIKATSFIVEITNNVKNIDIKPFYINSFHEKDNKLQIEIRHSITDIEDILKIIKNRHSYLPKFLIKNKDKFNINFYLLTSNLDIILNTTYENCVLRAVKNPPYQYGNNNIASVTLEFTYARKVNKTFKVDKLNNSDRLAVEEVYNINNIRKIKTYTDRLLDYAILSAENYYNARNDKETLAQVKSYIEQAKNENKNIF